MVTLAYNEKEWIKQPLASRVEDVNPFNVILYDGLVSLNPASDDFVVTREIEGQTINVFGESAGTFEQTFVESVEVAQWCRSRNIAFMASGIKPLTRFYAFFDGTSGVDIIPKLIQINMRSGTFINGENITGFSGDEQTFAARIAAPNHKNGPISEPTRKFDTNPYNKDSKIPSSYSASSSVLNIDILSLADIADERYYGYITGGTRIVGSTSGAVADVTEVQLVADTFAELMGCLWARDPYNSPSPSFRLPTGVRTFKLTSSKVDEN